MFLTIAESSLRPPRGHDRVEIIKAGTGGWGPVNELNYLLKYGGLYDPDLVVVFFFTGNDFDDAEDPFHFVEWKGIRLERRVAESVSSFREMRIALRKHVYLYGILVDSINAVKMSSRRRYAEDLRVLKMCDQEEKVPREATRRAVEGFARWSRERDVSLAFVILPHRTQVERDRGREIAEKFDIDAASLDLDRPSKLIAAILEENSIPYLDMTAEMRARAAGGDVIGIRGDSHYKAEIHAFIAQRVAEFLEKLSAKPASHAKDSVVGEQGDVPP